MYSSKPSLVYGFHGLEEEIAHDILNHKTEFKPSQNDYDWLGGGVYFWENNYSRALHFAQEKHDRGEIKKPFVLGALIDLGRCLDLLDQNNLDLLKGHYKSLKNIFEERKIELPQNSSFGKNDFDFKKRELDCTVIRYARLVAEVGKEEYDSVRAAFWEGDSLYPGAGFREKNHIQIAISNSDCIKGIFLPRVKNHTQQRRRKKST